MYFETERLTAEPWTLAQAPAAFKMYGDPEVMRYLGRNGAADTIGSLQEMEVRLARAIEKYSSQSHGYIYAALVEKLSGDVIGTALLKPLELSEGGPAPEIEIGWHLAHDSWGRGYGTETGFGLLKYGFETLGLDQLHAIAYPENQASLRIMQKIGMTRQGSTNRYYGVSVEHYAMRRPL